jgi:hypothetical protein
MLRALFGRPICARESTDADKLFNRVGVARLACSRCTASTHHWG